MQWNNKSALELFHDYTKHMPNNTKTGQKCDEATTKFIEHNVLNPSHNHRSLSMKFNIMLESKPGNRSSRYAVLKWEDFVFFEHVPASNETKKPRGRPSVTLGDTPCLKKARSILKDAVSCVEQFAAEQKLTKEVALQRLIDECNRTWHSSVVPTKFTIPDDDAVALMYNVNLSINQYQMIRTLCLPHGVVFPTRNKVDAAKKKFHTPITSYQLKSSVEITELMVQTAASLVNLAEKKLDVNVDGGGMYHLVGKFGVDGSGSHKIRQQLINTSLATEETAHLDPTKSNSFVLSCYCPLELRFNDTLLWTNPVPNSTSFARPVSLTRCVEDRDVLAVELEPSFNVIIREVYQSDVVLGDKTITVNCETECSMVDGKMVSLLQGDSGAFCHLCHASRDDANNINLITEGFDITKDYASCKTAWEELSSGEIAYSSIERQGQCHENIIKADLFCFSILHFKLRSLDFAQKILYHLVE